MRYLGLFRSPTGRSYTFTFPLLSYTVTCLVPSSFVVMILVFLTCNQKLEKEESHTFFCPFYLAFSRILLDSINIVSMCFSRVEGEGAVAELIFLLYPCDWCVGTYMVTLYLIHRSQRLQCRSVTTIPTMKHGNRCVTKPLLLEYQPNKKASD